MPDLKALIRAGGLLAALVQSAPGTASAQWEYCNNVCTCDNVGECTRLCDNQPEAGDTCRDYCRSTGPCSGDPGGTGGGGPACSNTGGPHLIGQTQVTVSFPFIGSLRFVVDTNCQGNTCGDRLSTVIRCFGTVSTWASACGSPGVNRSSCP